MDALSWVRDLLTLNPFEYLSNVFGGELTQASRFSKTGGVTSHTFRVLSGIALQQGSP